MLNELINHVANMNTTLQWFFVILLGLLSMSIGATLALITNEIDIRIPSWRVRR